MADLVPADPARCQVQKLKPHIHEGDELVNGKPPEYERCGNVPVVIVTPEDPRKGPMAICQGCLDHLRTIVPLGYFTTEPIFR